MEAFQIDIGMRMILRIVQCVSYVRKSENGHHTRGGERPQRILIE